VSLNGTNGSSEQRILVVDDERSIVDAVATALRYEGYRVDEAHTGRDALTSVAETEPDLVVLDWMLPDIEGVEVGRRLREQGFETAVLFLTAKDATENKVEALRAGGDDYVTKPFSLAEIVARIQAILRRTAGVLPGDVLRFADLVLDERRHAVVLALPFARALGLAAVGIGLMAIGWPASIAGVALQAGGAAIADGPGVAVASSIGISGLAPTFR